MPGTLGVRRYAAGALALAAATAVWWAATPAGPPAARISGSAENRGNGVGDGGDTADFSFVAHPLSPATLPGDRRLRPVAPGYANIRAWVSSTGAGVALFDADNEVVSDDVCLVDPRRDTVTVGPAPGTPRTYRPFTLTTPGREPYQAPTGCLPADLDQDGWQDVVVYYWGRSPSLFLRVPWARPSATAFRHRELVPVPEVWNTAAATVGDFDGDGRLDLVFGNYFPDGVRVLDGGAHDDAHGDARGEAVMPGSMSDARDGGRDRLYLATGPATFAEAEGAFDEAGGTGWTLALGTQDLDGDGRPELYVANDFGPDRLLVNESRPGRVRFREARGTRHLSTPRSGVLGEDTFKGRGVGFTDLNADGAPDILVGNTTEDHGPNEGNFAFVSRPGGGLHEGRAPYDDRGEELGLSRTGWSWDVKAADFDNDGDDEIMHATGFVRGETDRWAQLQEAAMANDLAVSNPALWPNLGEGDDLAGHGANSFLTRGPGGRYTDVARRAGVGGGTVGRAFAVGDVDDDGRLDFAVANQWAGSVLYRNHGVTAPFVGLRLRLPAGPCAAGPRGRTPTRPAVGAVARVRLPGGATAVRQLYPANGHNGVSAPELLFGLGGGAGGGPLPVELSWRDACGVPRTASVPVEPGWHHILLTGDGASEMERP
ncbi:RNA-binding protein [Streptosporangium violaceochromogenes]|nr:RNA-binding protein [Streptosporangium violaceochromogenes]